MLPLAGRADAEEKTTALVVGTDLERHRAGVRGQGQGAEQVLGGAEQGGVGTRGDYLEQVDTEFVLHAESDLLVQPCGRSSAPHESIELGTAGRPTRCKFGQVQAIWQVHRPPARSDHRGEPLGGTQPSPVRVQHAVDRHRRLERRQPLRRRVRAAQAAGGQAPGARGQEVEGTLTHVNDAPALDDLQTEQRPLASQRQVFRPPRRVVLGRASDKPDGPPLAQLGHDQPVSEELAEAWSWPPFRRSLQHQPQFNSHLEQTLLLQPLQQRVAVGVSELLLGREVIGDASPPQVRSSTRAASEAVLVDLASQGQHPTFARVGRDVLPATAGGSDCGAGRGRGGPKGGHAQPAARTPPETSSPRGPSRTG